MVQIACGSHLVVALRKGDKWFEEKILPWNIMRVQFRKIAYFGRTHQLQVDKSGWRDWSDHANRHTNCPSPYAIASHLPRPSCRGFTRLRFWRNQRKGRRDVVMRVLWLANKQVSPKRKWIECSRALRTHTRIHLYQWEEAHQPEHFSGMRACTRCADSSKLFVLNNTRPYCPLNRPSHSVFPRG